MTALKVHYGRKAVPVATIAEAVAWWDAKRDGEGFGASEMLGDVIIRKNGTPVARISYNGRVWNTAAWVPGMQTLSADEIAEIEGGES